MPNQNVNLCFVLDRLDTVHHADVFTHLERDFCDIELDVLQTLPSNDFVELQSKFGALFGNY